MSSSDSNTVRACEEGNRLTADDYVGSMVAGASMQTIVAALPKGGGLVRGIGKVVQRIGEGVSKIVQHTGDTVSVLGLLEEEEKGKEIDQEIDQILAFLHTKKMSESRCIGQCRGDVLKPGWFRKVKIEAKWD
ncbi:hypothetical protein GOBAR_DD11693 [Gossypium barbadense]|nr:hypothetical protein GOBAR_DD11693 [Gossypium barbadense]